MSEHFTPRDWYWVHQDGRIYASGRQAIVVADDAGFVAAEAAGRFTRWPADEDGEQTDAMLQGVLDSYSLHLSLTSLKTALKQAIDAAAERERMRYITGGAGQAMTYARKVEQARAVQADADPQPADYPLLAASIGIDGVDIQAVAATILGLDAAWEQIGAAIEAVRLSAKRAVDLASDAATAAAVTPLWPEP